MASAGCAPTPRAWRGTSPRGRATAQSEWERCTGSIINAQCGGPTSELMYRTICMRRIGNEYRALSTTTARRTLLVQYGCPPSMVGPISTPSTPRRDPPEDHAASHSLPGATAARAAAEAAEREREQSEAALATRLGADWAGFHTIRDEFTGEVLLRVQVRNGRHPVEVTLVEHSPGAPDATVIIRFFSRRAFQYESCHTVHGLAGARRLELGEPSYEQATPEEGGFLETVRVTLTRDELTSMADQDVIRFRVCSDVVEPPRLGEAIGGMVRAEGF